MAGVGPPPTFGTSRLELHTVAVGERFGRIYVSRHPDPLGFGKTPSRFSDPRRRVSDSRFGVLYLGETLKVCFLEAVLRDQRDGAIGVFTMREEELHERLHAEIEVAAPLNLVDLREDSAIRMGVPTDVPRASNQRLARQWSVAFHDHSQVPDGIIYPSRLNGQTNLAIYGRGVPKLRVVRLRHLIGAPGLAGVLDDLAVELAPPDP